MLTTRHDMRGFTMIELMIGVAVFAILVSVGAPSFMAWVQNTQLRTAAETISAGMQLAKAEAVRRNTNVQFVLTGAAYFRNGVNYIDSSWTVGCAIPVADLDGDGVADCPGTGLAPPLLDYIQKRSGTEGTSKADVTTNVNSVTFSGLGRATNAMNVSITNTTGGACQPAGPMRCLDVRVSQGGQILMCNPALQRSTNPQGC